MLHGDFDLWISTPWPGKMILGKRKGNDQLCFLSRFHLKREKYIHSFIHLILYRGSGNNSNMTRHAELKAKRTSNYVLSVLFWLLSYPPFYTGVQGEAFIEVLVSPRKARSFRKYSVIMNPVPRNSSTRRHWQILKDEWSWHHIQNTELFPKLSLSIL